MQPKQPWYLGRGKNDVWGLLASSVLLLLILEIYLSDWRLCKTDLQEHKNSQICILRNQIAEALENSWPEVSCEQITYITVN